MVFNGTENYKLSHNHNIVNFISNRPVGDHWNAFQSPWATAKHIPCHSCLSALLNVFDIIMHMLDSNSSVDMVYLDFSKAFDKVDHGILLHKLRAVGITGNIGIWLFRFLADRSTLC